MRALKPVGIVVYGRCPIGRFEPWANTQKWLATALPGFCRIVVNRTLESGLISPPDTHSTAMAVAADESFAYVTTRRADDENVEFGVHAFGLDAAELAENVVDLLQVWRGDHRDGPSPQFCVYPAGTPEDQLPEGCVIDKMHSWVTISWPQAMIISSRSQRPVGTTPTTSHRLENQS